MKNKTVITLPNATEQIKHLIAVGSESNDLTPDSINGMTTQLIGEHIIGGYLFSLLEIAQMAGEKLDLTYDTIKNIYKVLGYMYMAESETYPPDENRTIVGKTVAVYMMALCANVHNCEINYENVVSPLMAKETMRALMTNTWSGITAQVGKLEQIDFYTVGVDSVLENPIPPHNGFVVDFTGPIEAYKKATGDDLRQYGLEEIVMFS